MRLFFLSLISLTMGVNQNWIYIPDNNESIILFNSEEPDVSKEEVNLDFVNNEIKIFGIGESSHGQGSFFSSKHKLFKALVEQKGYTVFALEAGFSEALKANAYVHGNTEKSAKEVLSYLGYGVWENMEFIALLNWMKAYNDSVNSEMDKLSFVGIDCQKTHGFVEKYTLLAKQYLNQEFSSQEINNLYKIGRVYNKNLAKQLLKKHRYSIDKLIRICSRNQTLSRQDRFTYTMELSNLIKILMMKSSSMSNRLRAKFMAENAVLVQEYYNSPIVISAHNGHLIKGKKDREMGFYLNKLIGENYYSLGTEFFEGKITSFGMDEEFYFHKIDTIPQAKSSSLSYYFSTISHENFIYNFRNLSFEETSLLNSKHSLNDIMGCYGNTGCNTRYWKRNPIKSYDGILYIHSTKASHIFWEKRPKKGLDFEYYEESKNF